MIPIQFSTRNNKFISLFKIKTRWVSIFLLILFPVFLFSSCNNVTEVNTENEKSTSQDESSHQHDDNETLRLDNGKRWIVVKDMLIYIDYMKYDINGFTGSSVDDYRNLSTDLLINIDLLTANCTMKGDAHDQLHLWLLPYIDQVNHFVALESLDDSKATLQELKVTFKVFDQYFE